jgi:hypothetical protein
MKRGKNCGTITHMSIDAKIPNKMLRKLNLATY